MNSTTAVAGIVALQGFLSLVEVGLHLFAGLFPEQAIVKDNFSYDFIIVGAGSAGCILARRLSDNPNFNVLLIEAGDNPGLEEMLPGLGIVYAPRSRFDWNYTSVPDNFAYQCYKNQVCQAIRGHGLGGSSAINSLLYVRGDRNDYEQWADITKNPTWNYNGVLPYFIKGERNEDSQILNSKYKVFHGTRGEIGVNRFPDLDNVKYLEALEEVGFKTVLDTNGNYTLGMTFPMYNVAQDKRQSSCYCYVSPVKHRKNLHVLRNTKVSKVIFQNKRAVGVEIITQDNEKMRIKANLEVILSAGAFNSPQLLMLSGIGPREHLQSHNIETLVDLPVGHNLQDHVGVIIAHQTEKLKSAVPRPNPYTPTNFINGFVSLDKSQKYPDAQYLIIPSRDAQGSLSILSFHFNMYNDIGQRTYDANIHNELLINLMLNLRAHSRGRIMLHSSDINDQPKIMLNAFSDPRDLDNVIEYVKDYLRIENSTYFKSVSASRVDLAGDRCKGFSYGSYEYWRCYTLCLMVSVHHYSCTCAMGTVVDSKLRVYGVQGLRVVDASVFPVLPSGNINAPTMMVAEKAADMIKKDYF